MKHLQSVLAWWDQLTEPRFEYGLTKGQVNGLVEDARLSEQGWDRAQELALSGYGLTSDEFDELLATHGVGRR